MNTLQIIPLQHIGEITPKANLSQIILQALQKQSITIKKNDILIITQKIVSKAEGRIIALGNVKPSDFAKTIAKKNNKDAALIEVILQQSKRIVRMNHGVIISQTHHGFICANAGVDESNVGNNNTVTVLPIDPDLSAKRIHDDLEQKTKIKKLGVIISDTWGRPWREGQVNFAIGIYGLKPLVDYRKIKDIHGFELKSSIVAVADELASAAELVSGKIDEIPAVLIRGYVFNSSKSNGKMLLRNANKDLFR